MEPPVVGVDERPPLAVFVPLSLQHLLAMFGATVLVPVLLGVDPSTVLLFNGIGTLIFLVLCQWKVPAYLGSSFAFLPPALIIIPLYGYGAALGGFIASGILFILLAVVIKKTGIGWVKIVFPDAAMGAIVAVIGLELAPTAAAMAGLTTGPVDLTNIGIVLLTLGVMIIGMTACRGFLRLIPILLGLVTGYVVSVLLGRAVFDPILSAPWFSIPTIYTPVLSVPAIMTPSVTRTMPRFVRSTGPVVSPAIAAAVGASSRPMTATIAPMAAS
ncbi:MAG: solute carrier family 23 protein, partial [Methanoregula sp.]|nr:solute carrier family 23 protein [Methanoregula sp.]